MSSRDHVVVFFICSIFRFIHCLQKVPDLSSEVYEQRGDIDIGGLFSVHSFSKTRPCGESLYSTTRFQHIQALAYAVNKINQDSNLLPNITLGFKLLDDCVKSSTALGQTLNFIPRNESCRLNESAPYYKVKGVVGPLPSGNSILVASLLGLYKIPQISPLSTSAVLSDKTKYEYFLRVVPPDQYQAKAIVSLIDSFGWKYISAINSEGTYGSTGIRQVKSKAAELGICVAYAREISQGTSESDYDDIIRALMQNKEARAVVMFVGLDAGRKLLQAAQRAKLYGQFVWVFSDTFGNMNGHVGLEDVSAGSFFFKVYSVGVDDFNRNYVSLNPSNVVNPWYNQLWETVFNCSWLVNSPLVNCSNFKSINESRSYKAEPTASFVIDAVYTFGHALNRLIRSDCPQIMAQDSASRNIDDLDHCIRGDRLLSVLRRRHARQVRY
ncbi:metabotropic glutamate receptor-like [Tubulanus polymorphus]|uniref:metabotropic glutamate receptor-like n=1 Tax=Tubulanus polymorphus TaxID=672921 RepID=UPI003DA29A97